MKRFVLGDVHGRINALKEVLKKSKFDYDKDKLIILGDVADGGYNTYMVVEELLKVKNKIFIIGNHDSWFMDHIKSGWAEYIWLAQGGKNTIDSYTRAGFDRMSVPVTHQDFFNRGKYYYIEDEMLFVHGGFDINKGLKNTSRFKLMWDRTLIEYASMFEVPGFKKVFVGHSTTQTYANKSKPLKFSNLWMLDCGAGWSGKLAIMDIDTEKYWLSKKQRPATNREGTQWVEENEKDKKGIQQKV